MTPTPLIAVVGWKNSGKTTLTTRLVEEFTRRGLTVATVKHAHHSFQVDEDDTDSARHRRAGARQVAIVSPRRMATIREYDAPDEPALNDVIAKLEPADIIIVEGYKREPVPKIEARRREARKHERLADTDMLVLGIAADYRLEDDRRPVFDLDDITDIADFIDQAVGPLHPRTTKVAEEPPARPDHQATGAS